MQAGSGGIVFHVMNRAARRAPIFLRSADYRAFEELLIEAMVRVPIRLLAYAIMPNHFHLVLWPVGDRDLSRFMQWLTRTHAQRWHHVHGSVGTGALYQGRYRALAVQDDLHLFNVCRYVEQNPWRARLVPRATGWRWSSAWNGLVVDPRPILAEWPYERPTDWLRWIDEGIEGQDDDVRERVQNGVPYGVDAWVGSTAERLGLSGRVRGRGRPAARRTHPIGPNPMNVTIQGTIATPR